MLYMNDVEKTRERWIAWWNGELTDRCCVNINTRNAKPFTSEERKLLEKPNDEAGLTAYWTDPEWLVKRTRIEMEHTWYGGDSFPTALVNLGAAGQAGFFRDSKHHFDPHSVWFFPSHSDLSELEFDENSFLYRSTVDVTRALVEDSGGDYMVAMSDCTGNIDALSHLVGPDDLMIKMLEEPEEVLEALEKIQFTFKKIHETSYSLVKDNNMGGSCIGWLQTWAPGFHAQMQADMSVMFSNNMFREFVEPELRAQTELLDYSLYHLDGIEQIRHLDTLLSLPKLHAIQWTQVVGQPPCTDFIPELRKIQEAGKNLLIRTEPWQVETLMENLSSKGLCLNILAETQEEGEALLKQVEKLTHE